MEDREESMSDYEDYWVERNRIEGLEDAVEEDTDARRVKEGTRFREVYTSNGESIEVTINEEFAFIEYSNGTSSEIPLSELKFCPSCVKENKYPFSRHGDSCPSHQIEYFDFDIRRYEEFKVLSKLNGYHS